MNWAGLTVAMGLVGLAIFAAPYGLVILALGIWLWRRG